ncbi:hypothetical protein [Enterobacter hormaechei]|uniref:hypothetical protein n=1 Tax=Enterobacter hormaechei TaxID=158836 RepID=UPI000735CE77|nr:hypothetical protein [Enterobacter hormaechei]KTI41170.1 hypothetical protein ASV06_11350 [Enterobacter hormaechei subsp. xiangfangensis]
MKLRPLLGILIAILFLLGIDVLFTPGIDDLPGEISVYSSLLLWIGASIANARESEGEIDALKFHSEIFISICFGLSAYFLVKFSDLTAVLEYELYVMPLITSSVLGFTVFIFYWVSQRGD